MEQHDGVPGAEVVLHGPLDGEGGLVEEIDGNGDAVMRARLVPASEEKKKRGEEGWIAAACAAAESRTEAGASALVESLAAMGWVSGWDVSRRRNGALGFCCVYSDDDEQVLIVFWGEFSVAV